MKKLLVFCLLLMTSSYVFSEQVTTFDHITIQQGLSQSSVYSICQDSKGFLWFGTAEGLNRYDGTKFVVYKVSLIDSTAISGSWITAIYEDSRQNLWIGTYGDGLNRFVWDNEQFIHYQSDKTNPNSLSNNKINAICEDSNGYLWIGTNDGLNQLNLNTIMDSQSSEQFFTHYHHEDGNMNSLSNNEILSLCYMPNQELWIGTYGGGLNYMVIGPDSSITFKSIQNEDKNINSPCNNSIWSISADHLNQNLIWIVNSDDLESIDLNTGKFTHYNSHPQGSGILNNPRVLSINSRLDIWVGTTNSGLIRFDRKTNSFYNYKYNANDITSLSKNNILSLFEDREGILWIGAKGGGINKITRKKFIHYKNFVGSGNLITSNSIWSIFQDKNGLIWLGSEDGLNCLNPKTDQFTIFQKDGNNTRSISDNSIYSIYEDREGMFWIGTSSGGLNKMDRKNGTFQCYKNDPKNSASLSYDYVRCIVEDKKGNLWIGTRGGGINRFNKQTGVFKQYKNDPNNPNTISHNRVNALLLDKEEILWIATSGGGLNRFDPETETFTVYTYDPHNPSSLSDIYIMSLLEDRSGILWVGTYDGGLNRFNRVDGTFKYYTEKDGLPNNVVYAILEDRHGNLWMSTNKGLAKFDPQSEKFEVFDISDGLQANEFNSQSFFKNKDGLMFFGGINGFNMFNPENLERNTCIPPVVFTDLKILNMSVKHGENSPLKNSIVIAKDLEMSYKDYMFTLEFAALSFYSESKLKYAYKLEGFDEQWVYSNQPWATYTKTSGGTYTFHVKACNNDGVWNENGIAIKITIVPPFWKTIWFRIFIVSTLLCTFIISYWVRIRNIKIQQEKLEHLVEIRTTELEIKKIELENKNNELNKKNEILEKLNFIVRSINLEIDFQNLLQSILEATKIIPGVEKAVALVFDKDISAYRFRAVVGWDLEKFESIQLSFFEADNRYVISSEQIYSDIFITKKVKERIGEEKFKDIGIPQVILTMRIVIENSVAAYFIYENMNQPEAFAHQDIELLKNLKEHIMSAFIKALILDELKVLNEKKNAFLGMAAHDLRNPLSGMSNYIELIIYAIKQNRFDHVKGINDLEKTLSLTQRMSKLINDLLDITAIESGKIQLQMKYENIHQILSDSVEFHQRIAQQKEIQLHYSENTELPLVSLDANKISEVLDNLLSNAIKYTYPGGMVHIRSKVNDSYLIVSIEDTGQGLNKDELKDLFISFKKLSAKPTAGESSTGLGLAIVKKIIELHNGKIQVSSEKGKGTIFTFFLPLDMQKFIKSEQKNT